MTRLTQHLTTKGEMEHMASGPRHKLRKTPLNLEFHSKAPDTNVPLMRLEETTS
jgi:hypothetical protein